MLLPSLKPSESAYRSGEYTSKDKPGPQSDDWFKRSYYDPQPLSSNKNYYFEAISACMNRNRDNNGNGIIDADELRWFVPSSRMYLQLLLGENSMTSRIMDFESLKGKTLNTDNGLNNRYLYYTSDQHIAWAVEGLSLSDAWTRPYAFPAWQVRCVRNLGSDLSTITAGSKVEQPYQHDEKNKIVRMTYYDPVSIRSVTYTGNGTGANEMPVHMVTSEYNLPYKAFKYLMESPGNEYNIISGDFSSRVELINKNPCSSLNNAVNGYGWRLPNQKELAILRNLGVLSFSGSSYITSCTVSFFNQSGLGGDMSDNKFMGARQDASCQLGYVDSWNRTANIRCVRDYVE